MNILEEESGYFHKSDLYYNDTFSHFELIYSGISSPTVIYSAVKGIKRFIIKSLKPEYKDDLFYISQLKKEFEIGYLLDHPNIAKYYSFEDIEGKGASIVREWIDGTSFYSLINEHKIEEDKIIGALEELCDALEYLRRRQIVHRDIKPSNILITNDGYHLKLIDFGFSDSPTFSKLKVSGGTYEFASPEQKGDIDFPISHKSDLYSFGKLLEYIPLRKTVGLKKLIKSLTAQNPANRPDTIKEVKDYLNSHSGISNKRSFLRLPIFLVLIGGLISILIFINRYSQEESYSDSVLVETNSEETGVNNKDEQTDEGKGIEETKKNVRDDASNVVPKDQNQESETTNSDYFQESASEEEIKKEEVRSDVHPLEIITYNETLIQAEKIYKLLPDSIEDWKAYTREIVRKWLKTQVEEDLLLEKKCNEAIEVGIKEFEKSLNSSN